MSLPFPDISQLAQQPCAISFNLSHFLRSDCEQSLSVHLQFFTSNFLNSDSLCPIYVFSELGLWTKSVLSVLYFVLSPQPVLGFQQILRPVKSNCLFWWFSFGNKTFDSISDFTQQSALKDFQNWMKDMSCIPGGGQTSPLKVLLSRPNWSKL